MKKLLYLLLLISTCGFAQKFTNFPAGTTPLGGTEVVPIVQGGANKKVTAQDVADLGAAYTDAEIATLTASLQLTTTVSINGAATLDDTGFGKIHELIDNGGLTDYTVAPPAPSVGNSGKTIYFKGLSALTKVVTIERAAINIDGEANRKIARSGLIGLKSTGTHYVVISEVGSWIPYTATWVGFSGQPTGAVAKYFRVGKNCRYQLAATPTTSTTTTLTITMPFNAAANDPQATALFRIRDAGTWATGIGFTTSGSNILTFLPTTGQVSNWTASGLKVASGQIDFEIQ